LLGEHIPRRLLAADVALRQLKQERGDRFGDRRQVGHRNQAIAVANRPAGQLVQPAVALPLALLEVAHGVEDDHAATAAVGVHPQHRLLRHGAARQEHGGGLAEQRGDLGLECADDAAVAVTVNRGAWWDGREHLAGPDGAVPGDEAGALVAQFCDIGVGGLRLGVLSGRHGSHSAAILPPSRPAPGPGRGRLLRRRLGHVVTAVVRRVDPDPHDQPAGRVAESLGRRHPARARLVGLRVPAPASACPGRRPLAG